MKKIWFWVKRGLKVFGLLWLCTLPYYLYTFNTSGDRVREKCSHIVAGMTFSNLEAFTIDQGFTKPNHPTNGTGHVRIAEHRSFGRSGCNVKVENDSVVSSKFGFNDQ